MPQRHDPHFAYVYNKYWKSKLTAFLYLPISHTLRVKNRKIIQNWWISCYLDGPNETVHYVMNAGDKPSVTMLKRCKLYLSKMYSSTRNRYEHTTHAIGIFVRRPHWTLRKIFKRNSMVCLFTSVSYRPILVLSRFRKGPWGRGLISF